MSTNPSASSIDDLVDMFPQYPRSTIQDVLQRVGAAQAVETLLNFADDVSVGGREMVVASLDQFTAEMFRKEKTAETASLLGNDGAPASSEPWVICNADAGSRSSRPKRPRVPHDPVEAPSRGSSQSGSHAGGHIISDSTPLDLVIGPDGAGPSAVMPGHNAPDSLHHATAPPACAANPAGHVALFARESLPPTPPVMPSDHDVLAPSSRHGGNAACLGPSTATDLLPVTANGPQGVPPEDRLAEAPDPELWADDDQAPAPPPLPVGPASLVDLTDETATALPVVIDPGPAAAGEAAFLQGMFPDIGPADVALALSDAGDQIEAAVERLMELNEAGAERLRTPSSSDSGVDAEELPLEQKLMLLSLQFPDLAESDLRAALEGEGGSLEAATVLLEFYDREDKEKRAAADKAAANEALDRDLALKLQQQEEVSPPTPSAWHAPTLGAVNHPGSPLVARTPGGSLKVDDLRFAAKVAHLSHSFPDAGEEEVAAALLHADYHPNDAKQVLRTRGFKEVAPASLRVAAPQAIVPNVAALAAAHTRPVSSYRPPLAANGNVQGLSHLAKRHLQHQQDDVLYMEKRARAQVLFKKRDELQARAGHAWQIGDRALAQRLSDEVQALNAEAKAANDLAGKEIRNHKNSVYQIDLHGLHVHEALDVVEKALAERHQTFSFTTTIKFVTGRGSHSRNGMSKLVPAVRKWLEDRRIPYKIAMDSGSFLVPKYF